MTAPRRALAALILPLALLAVACQPLPRPFQPNGGASDTIPPGFDEKLGLFIAGIDDAPPGLDALLVEALAARLTARGIPASPTVANRGSYLLQCEATFEARRVRLHWQLIDADGEIAGLFDQIERLPAGGLAGAETEMAAAIAAGAAPRIAGLLAPGAPTSAAVASSPRASIAAPAAPLPAVVLRPVDGAPGDGDRALTVAMRRALQRRAIRLAPEMEDGAVMLLGSVETSPQAGGELVEVRWSVIQPDGAELGAVTQSNVVPARLLDGAWGEIALAVADGGAAGVAALLEAAAAPAASCHGLADCSETSSRK